MSEAAQDGDADADKRTLPTLLVTSADQAPVGIAGNSMNDMDSRSGPTSPFHR
jgi:hypothetical protein